MTNGAALIVTGLLIVAFTIIHSPSETIAATESATFREGSHS